MEETASTPHRTQGVAFILLVVLIVAAVAYVLFVRGFPFLGSTETLLAEGFPAERLSTVSSSGSLSELSKNVPGVLEDYAKGGGREVAIVRTNEGAFEIYNLSGGAHALTANGVWKASLAISPDGAWAAYAELLEFDTALEDRTSSWMIYVLNLENGEAISLTPGFAPQFFTRDGSVHLLYTSPEGLTLGNPEEATTQTLPLSVSQNIHAPITVSPAGTHVAVRDDAARIYSVFELQLLSPIIINPLRSLPREAETVVFSGGDILGIIYDTDARLVRYGVQDVGKDKELQKLPENEASYYLLP